MHYFNHEIDNLPHDLLEEIHAQTRLSGHRALDHILSLDNVPRDPTLYPLEWLRAQIVSLCKKHHARLLNPLRDIFFEETTFVPPTAPASSKAKDQSSFASADKKEQPEVDKI